MTSANSFPPTTSSQPQQVFDRKRLQRRRNRIAADFARFSFLKEVAAADIMERLAEVNRSFPRVLDLGAHDGSLTRLLRQDARVSEVYSSDIARNFSGLSVVADEEMLPFADASFDLVVSALSLHWVNDLPGALVQIRRILKPDGLFVGVLLGGRTLTELRTVLLRAEEERRGGAAMRVSPVVDVVEGARLLQRTGFAMPVADGDRRTIRYADPTGLLADLKGMGETACLASSAGPLSRATLTRALELYKHAYSDADGRVRATFELVTLSGWAPAPDQPRAKRPGSATVRLADALGVQETGTGVRAGGPED